MDPRTRTQVLRQGLALFACLGVLAVVLVFDHTLDPVVRGFGFAHARVVQSDGSQALVVDNLAQGFAESVGRATRMNIFGRRSYRVYEIFLPWTLLVCVLGLMTHGLATRLRRGRGGLTLTFLDWAVSPKNLWMALLLGGCLRVWQTVLAQKSLEPGLLPYALTIFGLSGLLVLRRPQVDWILRGLNLLTFARWLWLGYLGVAAWSFTRQTVEAGPLTAADFFSRHLVGCAVAFLALHWASRAPERVNVDRFCGSRRRLIEACDRHSQLVISETAALLLAVVIVSFEQPSPKIFEMLGIYAITSAVGALLMKWTLEGCPPWVGQPREKFWGGVCRVLTIAAVFCVPAVVASGLYPAVKSLSPFAWLFALCLGVLGGRPWLSGIRDRHDFCLEDSERQPRSRVWRVLAGAAIALTLSTLVIPAGRATWNRVRPHLGSIALMVGGTPLNSDLRHAFGYRVRVVETGGQALVLGQGMSKQDLRVAKKIVRKHLPGRPVLAAPVSLWRWEYAAWSGLLLSLAFIFASVPSAVFRSGNSRVSRVGIFSSASLAGVNGAFALGAFLGWFWLNPWPYAFAFITFQFYTVGLAYQNTLADSSKATPSTAPASVADPLLEGPPKVEASGPAPKVRVEVGRSLVGLLVASERPTLVRRMTALRTQVKGERGFLLPGVAFSDDLTLNPLAFRVTIRGVRIAESQLDLGPLTDPLELIEARLLSLFREHAADFITLDQTHELLKTAESICPVALNAALEAHSLVVIRDVFRALLKAQISVGDQESILNVLAGAQGSAKKLAELCRWELEPQSGRDQQ